MDDTNTQNTSVKEQTPKQQVVESLKGANNVLITISTNPTVDQLSACIGLTLLMNKLDKHATAVFSGAIPSTIDFLEPEKTIEQTTDSLRDFIISLDKSKADKLRYKVEDEVVRIYITPYRTSISQADLDFTQGDFNVDVVVALGIDTKDQLDSAIIEHGQILHDAVVIDMSCGTNRPVDMGSINWHDDTASSLCEMLVSISEAFQSGLLDTQISTAFLTGIVSETERFSNDKTTPKVMTMSAQLMAAGANQQLIANQLTVKPVEPEYQEPAPIEEATVTAPGELSINHAPEVPELEAPLDAGTVEQGSGENGLAFSVRDEPKEEDHTTVDPNDAAALLGASGGDVTDTTLRNDDSTGDDSSDSNDASPIEIDEHGNMVDLDAVEAEKAYEHQKKVIQPLNLEPPVQKTDLSTVNLDDAPAPDPVVAQAETPAAVATIPDALVEAPQPPVESALEVPSAEPAGIDQPATEQTLEDLERAVDSPHVGGHGDAENTDNARDAVHQAMAEAGYVPDAPSTMPQFPEPEPPTEVNIGEDQSQQPAPPAVPPPFMPPYMQPQTSPDGELNLPSPQ